MNAFGNIFRVSIFGESHGEQIGVVVDGLAPGIPLSEADFAADIARRRSGAKGTTPRVEADEPQILSGVYDGYTTGAPLAIVFHNTNTHSQDYEALLNVPRPGHADYTANLKYGGFQDPRGGGHFSGRLTLPVVAVGVIAKKLLFATIAGATRGRVQFRCDAKLVEIGGIADPAQWEAALDQAQKEGDSLGGVVECVVSGVPAGLGEPFWDSVESRLSHALFAIPGVRGVEFGDGFAAARMKGSEHNDVYAPAGAKKCDSHQHECCHEEEKDGCCCHGEEHEEGCCCHGEEHEEGGCCHGGEGHHEGGCCGHHRNRLVTPATNHAGGVNGGITNGNPLVFRVAFKPTSSIAKAQETYDFAKGEMTSLQVPGRHDTCFALRTPVIVEAMAAIVLADLVGMA
ncbi:MAG: chorismate synthase [Bacteroidales bacterium]|nr:chorismate synthase [Bacteroidales bacterium]